MNELFSAIWGGFAGLIGLAVFLALIWWIIRANAFWWRKIATRYSGKPKPPYLARKIPETIVVTGRPGSTARPGYRQYGAATIAIHADGLILDQVPPLNIHCPPLYLPFADMELRETDWMLWPEAYVIRMRRCPDADIIVAKRVVDWVRKHADAPPFGLGV